MAKVDQRKYLKKYLESDHSDHRKKKKKGHSESRSSRVHIIDDDAEYSRKRNYDDDNDVILTGEDAPQIVGIVDDRPPELKTIEDFRSSGKWKSVANIGERSRTDNRHRNDLRYDRRSRSPRSDRNETTKKRPTSEDYSPPRRKRDHESKEHQANLYKREKSSSESDHSQTQNRGGERHSRGGERHSRSNNSGRYRKSKSIDNEGTSYRTVYSSSRRHTSPSHKTFHDVRNRDSSATTASRFKEHSHSTESRNHPESSSGYERKSRFESSVKFNPFRSNPQSSLPSQYSSTVDDQPSRRTPIKPNNPFRLNPSSNSLSPMPEKRTPTNGRNSFRPQYIESGNRYDDKPKINFNNGSTYSSDSRKGFNPFRAEIKTRELSPLPDIRGNEKNKRNDNVPAVRSYAEKKFIPRDSDSRQDSKDRSRQMWSANGSGSFRRNSPLKSVVKSFNQPRNINLQYDSERRNQFYNRREDDMGSRHNAQVFSPQRKVASQISDTRYRPSSDYASSKSDSRRDRWDSSEYRRR